jgi:hypothetical protein
MKKKSFISFFENTETPLLDKEIELFIKWHSKTNTIYKFERQKN